MAFFRTPERSAANPPCTWDIVQVAPRVWHVIPQCNKPGDGPLDSFKTKREAVAATQPGGRLVKEYESEARWFAGETPPGYRSWIECEPEVRRVEAMEAAR